LWKLYGLVRAQELDAPVPAKAAVDESFGGGVDVSDLWVLDEAFECADDLGAFVGISAELGLCEQGVQNAEERMTKLDVVC
jgi:hypothetical protein